MATPRLMGTFTFDNELHRDEKKTLFDVYSAINSSESKNETIGIDEKNNPIWSINNIYKSQQDLTDAFAEMTKYADSTVITMAISRHQCPHAENAPQSDLYGCRDAKAEYVESIK